MKFTFILSVLFFASFFSSSAQDKIEVVYKSVVHDEKDVYGDHRYLNSKLVTTATESVYSSVYFDTIVQSKTAGEVYQIGIIANPVLYKNLKENYVISNLNQGTKELLKDENYAVEWKTTGKTKNVLSYTCQEAVGVFRGRSYRVYFSKEIPFSNGPYKFDGLPGLILEVRSDDGVVSIIANSILIGSDVIVKNPYFGTQAISWQTYLKAYKRYFDKVISFRTDGEGSQMCVPKRFIEVVLD